MTKRERKTAAGCVMLAGILLLGGCRVSSESGSQEAQSLSESAAATVKRNICFC